MSTTRVPGARRPAARGPRRAGTPRRLRGAATLVVVMVLFFIMMLVTAYANRSLIFEQKTSANQYRSTQAFEAAEAGLEWALAMLNQGLVDEDCVPSALGAGTFRDRYVDQVVAQGTFGPLANAAPLGSTPTVRPGCVRNGDTWACACPNDGNTPIASPGATDAFPAFTVEFGEVLQPGTVERYPGLVRIVARGCSGIDPRCVQGAATTADAYVPIEMKAALVRAVAAPPAAAVTAGGEVSFAAAYKIVNTDSSTGGVTIHSGAGVDVANARVLSAPGSRPENTTVSDDAALSAPDTNEDFFRRYFEVDYGTYRELPSVVQVACPPVEDADCSVALAEAAATGKRMFWIDGPLVVTEELTLGTPDRPVVLIATGRVRFVGPVRINGILYGTRLRWENTGPDDSFIRGAVVMRDTCCSGSGTPALIHDADIVNRLHRITGSFVRVNGSWKESFN